MNPPLPLELDRPPTVRAALSKLANESDTETRGAFFTKPEVVEGMIDLGEYTPDRELQHLRVLEPAFGNGEFLLPVLKRLTQSCHRQNLPPSTWPIHLRNALLGVELHQQTYARTRTRIERFLQSEGMSPKDAKALVLNWLIQDDFLLTEIRGTFDLILGNPPYVRQERVPAALLHEYKHKYTTLYDRADLYVLFYERGLDLLSAQGVLGFICANRWVKNKYGGPLRSKIATHFNLDVYIDLERVNAFQSQVDAYPAITMIRRAPAKSTVIVNTPREQDLDHLFAGIKNAGISRPHLTVVSNLTHGSDPWLLDSRDMVEHLRQLEKRFPCLEASGAKVGIGVATGCDRVYIDDFNALPVEKMRKLPLVLASDCKGQTIDWGGRGVINPWTETGTLADLNEFPKLARYLKAHEVALRARHTAKQYPRKWYKTIDRIYPNLTHTPKLLIPDIKGEATVVYDSGMFYPHHNLYVITSDIWDLQVLQALLRSSVALMFVAAYSVRMAGGFLRFQAQYLRRIRVPNQHDISQTLGADLSQAATSHDQEKLDHLAAKAYGLTQEGLSIIRRFADGVRVSNLKKAFK